MKFVIYTRLSKEDKTRTQHGFDSQRADIDYYLSNIVDHEVVGEFSEFISGSADSKPELNKAMHLCKKEGATLLVAKLDRLSRKVVHIATYMDSGVDFKVATMPKADSFQLHIYAALAQQEREAISNRVKRGLEAAKAKGVKLGAASDKYKRNPNNATTRNRKEAVERTERLREPLKLIVSAMANPTLKIIAQKLTENGYALPSGVKGEWKPSQVGRVMDRLNIARC